MFAWLIQSYKVMPLCLYVLCDKHWKESCVTGCDFPTSQLSINQYINDQKMQRLVIIFNCSHGYIILLRCKELILYTHFYIDNNVGKLYFCCYVCFCPCVCMNYGCTSTLLVCFLHVILNLVLGEIIYH